MIVKRGTRFAVVVYDSVTQGKRWVGTYDTRKEANRAEAQAKLERRATLDAVETCDEFANRWVESYPRKRAATNQGYAERVSKFAEDFSGVPLNDVTRKKAREWSLENPSRFMTVRTMFSDAVRDGLCETNPFVAMRLPGSRGRKDALIPTMSQVDDLARHARELRGPIFEAFVLTAAYTGMRPGELYALQWPQVHLDRMEVDVVASYSSKTGQLTLPKNNKTRIVAFPERVRDSLQGIAKPDGWCFETITGKRLTGRTLHYHWDAVRIAAGLPGLDLYTLRHACATYLLNDMGIPAHQVAEHLGHRDGGRLVQELYGHPSAVMAREAIHAAFGSNVVPLRPRSVAGSEA